ncbi:MAG: hypothetical protein ACFFDI_28220 [Promethearchaeota archaeon]
MTRRFIFDTSSIIVLAEIGCLQLFCDLLPNVYVTSKVLDEISVKPLVVKKAVQELISQGKIGVIDVPFNNATIIALYSKLGLHTGEISVLLAADKANDIVIFDDAVARTVARAEGFTLTGLLGLLVQLRRSGKLSKDESLAILSAINSTNFRMTAALYEAILKELTTE